MKWLQPKMKSLLKHLLKMPSCEMFDLLSTY